MASSIITFIALVIILIIIVLILSLSSKNSGLRTEKALRTRRKKRRR